MNQKKNITIILVSDIKINKSLKALLISSKKIQPFESLFFTSKEINLSKKNRQLIKLIKIEPINSLKSYSEFIIYSLHEYIKTSHLLIVQWDGYVINSKKWNPKFLDFDYIGAPFIPRELEINYSKNKDGKFFSVGNGGFSLRSKKLLEMPSKFSLRDEKAITNFHEDGFFCVLHREFFESKGLRWAPYSLAKEFSIETPLSISDFKMNTFGFHGNKMYIINFIKKIFGYFKNRLD
tara:strand:- start:283 stop:990 length:708 start_codon:yes stop_codon:yes gene_type:complete